MAKKLRFWPFLDHQGHRVFQSNRRMKLPFPKRLSREQRVNAIVIAIKLNGELFHPGIYFTVAARDGQAAFNYS